MDCGRSEGMQELLKEIECLKNSETRKLIDSRIKEFQEIGKNGSNELFKELCFCILTANCSAEKCIILQKKLGNDFLTLSEKQLAKKLKQSGYRHPNIRAKYILEARKYKNSLKETINSFKNESEAREWLVGNVKGIGFKEGSHFLRNTGKKNVAIIDFHIIDLLVKEKLIDKPKTLNKKKYLEIETLLKKIARKSNLNLAELDLYLWSKETGKVLK
ncbi:MAG: N-glycosylase/DNA lyase [archaeon]